MDPHESTVANADLWARYFEEQWSRWLNPLGPSAPLSEMAEGTAARIANLLTLVAAAPIAWLYSANAPHVSEIAQGRRPAEPGREDPGAGEGEIAPSVA